MDGIGSALPEAVVVAFPDAPVVRRRSAFRGRVRSDDRRVFLDRREGKRVEVGPGGLGQHGAVAQGAASRCGTRRGSVGSPARRKCVVAVDLVLVEQGRALPATGSPIRWSSASRGRGAPAARRVGERVGPQHPEGERREHEDSGAMALHSIAAPIRAAASSAGRGDRQRLADHPRGGAAEVDGGAAAQRHRRVQRQSKLVDA